jgi:hypothetical protein
MSHLKKNLGCPAHNLATVLSELYILCQQVFNCCFRITVFWIVILCSLVVVCQPLKKKKKKKTNLMYNLFLACFLKLYMFQVYLGPSSKGTTYVYNSWYLFFLDDCLLSWLDCSNQKNRISCASSWFFFTQLYRDAWSTKHTV